MYSCTFPRMRTLKFCCAAFAVAITGLPSSAQNAQNARTGSSAQAELHITAIVAPVIIPPRRDRHRGRDGENEGIVSYNLASQEQKLSIKEEVRPMLVTVNGGPAQQQPVQLTTVVVQ